MKMWTAAATIMAITGALAVGILARPYLQRRSRQRPWFTYSCAPLSETTFAGLGARPGWSRSLLTVTGAVTLNGLIRRPNESAARWLVFFPGNDATQLAGGQRFLDSVRAGHDWGLAVFAARGYDSSGGRPGPAPFASDGVKVIEYLIEKERVEPSNIHVVAFSLGGFTAVHAVAHMAKANQRVASLTLLASVAEAEMVYSPILARVMFGDIYRTLPELDGVPGPVLVLHGGADEALDIRQGRQIAARLGPRGTFREVPGARHSLIENDLAIRFVRDMIQSPETQAPSELP